MRPKEGGRDTLPKIPFQQNQEIHEGGIRLGRGGKKVTGRGRKGDGAPSGDPSPKESQRPGGTPTKEVQQMQNSRQPLTSAARNPCENPTSIKTRNLGKRGEGRRNYQKVAVLDTLSNAINRLGKTTGGSPGSIQPQHTTCPRNYNYGEAKQLNAPSKIWGGNRGNRSDGTVR